MEHKVSLLSAPDKSNPRPQLYICKIHFNIILPYMPSSSWWFLSFRFHSINISVNCKIQDKRMPNMATNEDLGCM
jgi:hypothetical protein